MDALKGDKMEKILDTSLKEFGYIEGGYNLGACKKCGHRLQFVQKYSWHCFDCASKLLKEKLEAKGG